jgi:hypothetical protein
MGNWLVDYLSLKVTCNLTPSTKISKEVKDATPLRIQPFLSRSGTIRRAYRATFLMNWDSKIIAKVSMSTKINGIVLILITLQFLTDLLNV